MPNATTSAEGGAMPVQGPLSVAALSLELLRLVDALDKVRNLMSAALCLSTELNLVELNPMMTVLLVAEDELDQVYGRLDACRPRKDQEAAR